MKQLNRSFLATALMAMAYRAEAGEDGTAGAVAAAPVPVFNNKIDKVETSFFFKKVTDDAGNESKRPTVKLDLPRPSVEGIMGILQTGNTPEGAKAIELILEAVGDVVAARARQILNTKEGESLTSDNFPMAELDWQTIANLPKADRRESLFTKEQWDDFAKDYLAVMPSVSGKAIEKVALAAKVFLKKFSIGDVKQDKKALSLLRSQLAMYISNTPNAEANMDIVEWLDKKAETLINAEPEKIGEAL